MIWRPVSDAPVKHLKMVQHQVSSEELVCVRLISDAEEKLQLFH